MFPFFKIVAAGKRVRSAGQKRDDDVGRPRTASRRSLVAHTFRRRGEVLLAKREGGVKKEHVDQGAGVPQHPKPMACFAGAVTCEERNVALVRGQNLEAWTRLVALSFSGLPKFRYSQAV